MHVTVFGAGYVGLVTGACLARLGHRVSVLEINTDRLRLLEAGRVPFHEPGLQSIVDEAIGRGALAAVGDASEALEGSDMALVCVGTPLRPDGDSDLSQVVAACETIRLIGGEIPVVFRSTLPLGSTEHLADWLDRDDLSSVATNPEFLRQGSAVSDFLNPTRIVIGTHSGGTTAVSEALERLYEGIEAPRIITDFASAEMIKNAANAFLGTKLSFVNEVADLCEAYDANVDDVMAGIGLDPRIGSTYLRPGIGFGGSCLPKELANMVRLGRRHGLEMALLSGAARTNDERATRVADRLEDIAGPLHGARVAILGLAFKADTDDVRYSPSLALASTLIERGASVRGHDPAVAPGAAEHVVPDLARAATPEEAVMAADLVILGTAWPLYRELDWASLGAGVAHRVIFDGSAAVDREAAERAGWRVITVGRSEG